MAIFPHCEVDAKCQIEDKIRIRADKSFISKDNVAITKVEIKPSTIDSFIEVTGPSPIDPKNWYLDWEYSSNGTKTISVKITAGTTATITKDITVLSEAEDALLSKDSDLVAIETDILNWVPKGRNSFIFQHRRAKELILDYLDNIGITDSSLNRLTATAFKDVQEFKEWSVYLTLKLIFNSISNQEDDRFASKAKYFATKETDAQNRAILRVDIDGDGTISASEKLQFRYRSLIRV